MKIILIPLFILFTSALNANELILLGSIAVDCKDVHIEKITHKVSHEIKPNEAVNIANQLGLIKCNSKLEQHVYTDSSNYYIIKSLNALSGNIKQNSVVINGTTGKVTEH